MDARASAYAALGLAPGAGRDEVERAYRDLIKRHHPDRSGGDSQRAAEINRAYFELRRKAAEPPVDPPASRRRRPRSRSRDGSRSWPVLLLGLVGIGLLQAGPISRMLASGWREVDEALTPAAARSAAKARLTSGTIDDPLDEQAVALAVRDAVVLARGGAGAMTDYSRACHRRLREAPSISRLDRCASFDIAASELASAREGERFGVSELTARQMNAANLLSGDFLAIERRLDQIRVAVEERLRPPEPPPTDYRSGEPPPPPPRAAGAGEASAALPNALSSAFTSPPSAKRRLSDAANFST